MRGEQRGQSWIVGLGVLAVAAGLLLSAWIHADLLQHYEPDELSRSTEESADILTGGDGDVMFAREERKEELLSARVIRWLLLGGGVVALAVPPIIRPKTTKSTAYSDKQVVDQSGSDVSGRPPSPAQEGTEVEEAAAPRFCPECGKDAGGDRFCSSCGIRLRH